MGISDLNKKIGAKIRSAREDVGLTQTDVADLLGIQQTALAAIENGRNALRIEHLMKLPEILGKPVSYFLEFDTDFTDNEIELVLLFRKLDLPLQVQFLRTLRLWVNFDIDDILDAIDIKLKEETRENRRRWLGRFGVGGENSD